jgi:nicotinate-nucleotide adenylyltransferase
MNNGDERLMSENSLQGTVGILGGSFDPVHIGHLIMAEQALEQFQLSKICWLPAASAPYPQPKQSTRQDHRLEMVRLATSGNSKFYVDDREIRRGGQSYTVETLEELHKEFPSVKWVFFMGADSLTTFQLWKQPERICQLARVVVVNRAGQPPPEMSILAEFLPESTSNCEWYLLHRMEMPQIEISSTDIRTRVKNGQSIRYLVPPAVEAYISAQGLYGYEET